MRLTSGATNQLEGGIQVDEDPEFDYQVLVNDEEQYSIWPTFKEIPKGWRQVGPVGKKQVCLDYIEEVWTDMRPLSVRKMLQK